MKVPQLEKYFHLFVPVIRRISFAFFLNSFCLIGLNFHLIKGKKSVLKDNFITRERRGSRIPQLSSWG
jgi:hypothetical protein